MPLKFKMQIITPLVCASLCIVYGIINTKSSLSCRLVKFLRAYPHNGTDCEKRSRVFLLISFPCPGVSQWADSGSTVDTQ